ncbi:hypothetical protein YC2023_094551 [Brassica napus]
MAGGNRSSTIDEAESGGGSVAMESKEIPQPQPVEVLSANAPPPFLSKTYDMVDDPATDPIVSWSSNNNSFVVSLYHGECFAIDTSLSDFHGMPILGVVEAYKVSGFRIAE